MVFAEKQIIHSAGSSDCAVMQASTEKHHNIILTMIPGWIWSPDGHSTHYLQFPFTDLAVSAIFPDLSPLRRAHYTSGHSEFLPHQPSCTSISGLRSENQLLNLAVTLHRSSLQLSAVVLCFPVVLQSWGCQWCTKSKIAGGSCCN